MTMLEPLANDYGYYPRTMISLCGISYDDLGSIRGEVQNLKWEVVWGPAELVSWLDISYPRTPRSLWETRCYSERSITASLTGTSGPRRRCISITLRLTRDSWRRLTQSPAQREVIDKLVLSITSQVPIAMPSYVEARYTHQLRSLDRLRRYPHRCAG